MFEVLYLEKNRNSLRNHIVVFTIGLLFIILGVFCFGYRMGYSNQKKYFNNNTQKYLKGYTLNIPEEITRVADEGSNQITHLIALKDPYDKVITIGFIRNGDNDKTKDKEEEYDDDYEDSTHNEIRPIKFIIK